MNNKKYSLKKGVTLLELMIYSFLSFFVIAVIMNAFFNTNKNYFEQRSSFINIQDAREAINFLGFDLSHVGLKFYYYKDSITNQYINGNIDWASYKSSGDLSSFKLVDQKDSTNDELTVRSIVLNDNGQPVDKNGNALDMTNSISQKKAVVKESRYYVKDGDLHKEEKILDFEGGIDNLISSSDYVITENIKAFQVECGLVGSNNIIRNKDDNINSAYWGYTTSINSVTVNGTEIAVDPSTSTVQDLYYGNNGKTISINKGSRYMFSFNVKADSNYKDVIQKVSLVLTGTGFNDTVGVINKLSDSYNTLNFQYDASASKTGLLLHFYVNSSSVPTTGNLYLSNLYIFEYSKGHVSWVGDEVGKKFWEETEEDYFPSHTQSEWTENKKNVRVLRVSLVSETKRNLSAERRYNFKVGNINYDVTSKKENKVYRTVIPVESNGQFPTVENVLGSGIDNISSTSTSTSTSSTSSVATSSSSSSSSVVSSSSSSVSGVTRTLTVSTEGMGSTTPSASTTYSDGETVNLSAVADNGWEFDHWIGNVDDVNSATTTITLNSDETVSAVFKQLFTVTINSTTHGTVTLSPSGGTYRDGTSVELTATPDVGYTFTGWGDDITGTANPYTFAINSDMNVSATFSPANVLTNKIPDNLATVKIDGTIVTYGNTISISDGNSCDIEVTPTTGYTFGKWVGDLYSEGTNSSLLGYTPSTSIELEATILGSIGDYSFEGDASDNSAYSHDGTVSGATFVQSCVDTKGLKFDGVDNHVDIGDFNVDGDQMTVSAWILPNQFSNDYPRVIDKSFGRSPSDHIWALSLVKQNSTTAQLRFSLTTTNGNVSAQSGTIELNKWYNVSAVYDGSAIIVYVNGSSVTSASISGDVDQTTDKVWIGGSSSSGVYNRYFSGIIDEVKIYNKALTISEISDLYTSHSLTCKNYNVTVTYNNSEGDVTVDGNSYNSGTNLIYGAYSNVILEATPVSGYDFKDWSGDLISTKNPATLVVDGNKIITGNFSVVNPTVMVTNVAAVINVGEYAEYTMSKLNGTLQIGNQLGSSFVVNIYDENYNKISSNLSVSSYTYLQKSITNSTKKIYLKVMSSSNGSYSKFVLDDW